MLLSKFSLSLAFLGSIAAVGISSAQAMMGEESQKEIRKAVPAAPTPLKQDHPLYRQIRSLTPSGDLTVDHADAYQQLQNLLEKSTFFPDKMYFQRVLGAREAGIDLKNVSDLFLYGELQGWLSKGESVTKANFEAARQLNTLLEKAPFAPNKMYFQRVLSAREAGIELKNVSDLFTYGELQGWLSKGESVTKTHFEAARQLNTLLEKAPVAPNKMYFQRVLGAGEAGIELKNISELFLYGDLQDWLSKGEPVTKTHFEAARQLSTLLEKAPVAPNKMYFQRILGAREAGIDFKNVSDLFTYEEVSDILKSQPTSTQFQAYQNLKRSASSRSVTKTQIEDEVKRMASAAQ
ncbi:MAG: hypothetical protein ACRCYP_00880 [Alphaproteobacteria bacterium]